MTSSAELTSDKQIDTTDPLDRIGAAKDLPELLRGYLDISKSLGTGLDLAFVQKQVAEKLLELGETDRAMDFILASNRTIEIFQNGEIVTEQRRILGEFKAATDKFEAAIDKLGNITTSFTEGAALNISAARIMDTAAQQHMDAARMQR